jgi:hypothetical protein
MKMRRLTLLLIVIALLVTGVSFSTPAPAEAQEAGIAYVRAVHASPDAPAVDIYVGKEAISPAVSALAFGKATGWIPLPAGRGYDIVIRAAGAAADSAPVFEKNFTLTKDASVLIAAMGLLNDTLGNAKFDLKAYSINRLDPKDKTRLDFIHASPDSPAADILVNGRASIRTLRFGRKTLVPVELAGETADIKLTPENKNDQPLIDVPAFRLQPGKIITVMAIGLIDSLQPLVLVSDPYVAFVRLVHAAPGAPGVDVYLDGNFAFGTLYFSGFSNFLRITAGPHDVALRAGGSSASSDPIYEVKGVNFAVNSSTTVLAQGFIGGEGAQAFGLALYPTNRAPLGGKARVYVIHASPDAPNVDVYLGGSRAAVRNLRFGKGTTVPLEFDPGAVDIRVNPAGNADTSVISAPGYRLRPDTIYTIIAADRVARVKPLVLTAPTFDPLNP